ncbi:MAG: excinuclease ABC subunit C [Ignavibacteria bacterium]|nr:MAG: excinuclease ABC subunit C [Ignavibacteria bacterium]
MVERNLAKVDVAGSSPVSRSPNPDLFGIFFLCSIYYTLNCEFLASLKTRVEAGQFAITLQGAVPKWLKGKLCKSFIRRFESDRRLNFPKHILCTPFTFFLVKRTKKRYIGFTNDIEKRLTQHNSGLVTSTRHRRPLNLIYSETFESKTDAMKREKEIKNKKGKFIIT